MVTHRGIEKEHVKKAIAAIEKISNLVIVEGNATGQLAQLIRQHTNTKNIDMVLKYDGRPFMADELTEQLEQMVTA